MKKEWGSLADALALARRSCRGFSEGECKILLADAMESGWVAYRVTDQGIIINLPGLAKQLDRNTTGMEAAVAICMLRTGKSQRQARAAVAKAIAEGKLEIETSHPSSGRVQ